MLPEARRGRGIRSRILPSVTVPRSSRTPRRCAGHPSALAIDHDVDLARRARHRVLIRNRTRDRAAERRDTGSIDRAYSEFDRRIADVALTWDTGMRASIACEPSDVAERVLRAAASNHPRARYRVAPSAAIMLSLRRVLPERAFEAVLRTQFPSPRPSRH